MGPDPGEFRNPTFSGRVGFRPNEMLNLGFSASEVPTSFRRQLPACLRAAALGIFARSSLRTSASPGIIFNSGLKSSRHASKSPIGNADTLSYYIEGKYKINSQLFTALRWNQQLYGNVPNGDDRRSSGAMIFGALTPSWVIASRIIFRANCNTVSPTCGAALPSANNSSPRN